MCGIVGLFLKQKRHEAQLGTYLEGMLATMCDRGPDSAGFAVYSKSDPRRTKLTVRAPSRDFDFDELCARIQRHSGLRVTAQPRDTHAVLKLTVTDVAGVREALAAVAPEITIVGAGASMEIYKEVGRPDEVANRFRLALMAGTHGIGHTRMATESAVTTDGAHPFSTGPDQCLVHNGSLSNHNAVRRELQREGMTFETENDSEVAAGYLTWRLTQGASLRDALTGALDTLDGFYTFVVGTKSGFGVLRDPIACKPAVLAETDGYVAFGSEYRALATLPGIREAKVWEPEPATVYLWERA